MEMEELKERGKELDHQGKPTWRWEPEDGGREHGLKEVEHGHEGGDQVDEGGEQEDRGREVGWEEVEQRHEGGDWYEKGGDEVDKSWEADET